MSETRDSTFVGYRSQLCSSNGVDKTEKSTFRTKTNNNMYIMSHHYNYMTLQPNERDFLLQRNRAMYGSANPLNKSMYFSTLAKRIRHSECKTYILVKKHPRLNYLRDDDYLKRIRYEFNVVIDQLDSRNTCGLRVYVIFGSRHYEAARRLCHTANLDLPEYMQQGEMRCRVLEEPFCRNCFQTNHESRNCVKCHLCLKDEHELNDKCEMAIKRRAATRSSDLQTVGRRHAKDMAYEKLSDQNRFAPIFNGFYKLNGKVFVENIESSGHKNSVFLSCAVTAVKVKHSGDGDVNSSTGANGHVEVAYEVVVYGYFGQGLGKVLMYYNTLNWGSLLVDLGIHYGHYKTKPIDYRSGENPMNVRSEVLWLFSQHKRVFFHNADKGLSLLGITREQLVDNRIKIIDPKKIMKTFVKTDRDSKYVAVYDKNEWNSCQLIGPQLDDLYLFFCGKRLLQLNSIKQGEELVNTARIATVTMDVGRMMMTAYQRNELPELSTILNWVDEIKPRLPVKFAPHAFIGYRPNFTLQIYDENVRTIISKCKAALEDGFNVKIECVESSYNTYFYTFYGTRGQINQLIGNINHKCRRFKQVLEYMPAKQLRFR